MDAKDIILGAKHNTQRFSYIFNLLQVWYKTKKAGYLYMHVKTVMKWQMTGQWVLIDKRLC